MSDSRPMARRGLGTRVIHGVAAERPSAVSTPIVHSVTFSFGSLAEMQEAQKRGAAGAFYQRVGHPTLHACEKRLADIEETESALLFSSGMAALTSLFLALVRSGEHIVALAQCYGGTLEALQWGADHLGWSLDLVDAREPRSWAATMHRGKTKLFHIESPTNPTLCVLDIGEAARLAHAHGALLSVDNTVPSPIGQHALRLGADLVMYSATKSIGGHSDLLAGAVLGSSSALESIWQVRSIFGAVPDPAVAWLIERSLKTMAIRVERANSNAQELAQRLSGHAEVTRVYYPGLERHPGHETARRQMSLGFGPLLSFEVRGGDPASEAIVDGLRLIRHAASLGGVETLVALPAHTSHRHLSLEERRRAGIPAGLVRISAGIEDVEDLWSDLEQALALVGAERR